MEDIPLSYPSKMEYKFTNDGYFYGSASASYYSVNGTEVGWQSTASIRAEILDESGKTKHIVADISGYEVVTSAKVFLEIKKGWTLKIVSQTCGGNRGSASVGGTATYIKK